MVRRRLLNTLTRVALALGFLAAGLPHALCACGHCGPTKAARPAADANRCPHCCEHDSPPTPDAPAPCKCRDCQQPEAMLPGGEAVAPSTQSSWLVTPGPASLIVPAPADGAADLAAETALGGPPRYGCALPILLGHLLF